MKEKIYTIPLSEAFDRPDGCPICRLRAGLEEDGLRYVLGPAMMEPAVRIETNRLGFCGPHLKKLGGLENKLSLALVLESWTDRLKAAPGGRPAGESCFLCRRAEKTMGHFFENMVLMWKTEPEFALRLNARRNICLPHTETLLLYGKKLLSRKEYAVFSRNIERNVSGELDRLHGLLAAFCESFDYRRAGEAAGEEAMAVELTVAYLGGEGESL